MPFAWKSAGMRIAIGRASQAPACASAVDIAAVRFHDQALVSAASAQEGCFHPCGAYAAPNQVNAHAAEALHRTMVDLAPFPNQPCRQITPTRRALDERDESLAPVQGTRSAPSV
jgi:hypothetical protein